MPSNASSAPSQRSSQWQAIGYIVLACLILVGFQGWTAWQARQDDLAKTRAKTENLARFVGDHLTATIDAVDIALRGVVEHMVHDGFTPEQYPRIHGLLGDRVEEL